MIKSFNPLFWGFLWNYVLTCLVLVCEHCFQSSFLRFSLKLMSVRIRLGNINPDFQSSFLRFSLKHREEIHGGGRSEEDFQSSFLRFSLKLLPVVTFSSLTTNDFQSSFLRFSLKLFNEDTKYDHTVYVLSILFFEVFFETTVIVMQCEGWSSSFQSSFLRFSLKLPYC